MSIGRVPGQTGIQPSIVDAKGDIIAATAADSVSRLAVGANDTVLTADSSTATGLKWATPAAPAFVGVRLFNSSDPSIANNTSTSLTFNSESWDTDGFHSTVTNTSRITIPTGKGGKYLVTAKIEWYSNSTGARSIAVLINGGNAITQFNTSAASVAQSLVVTTMANFSAGDYIEMSAYQTSGGSLGAYGRTDLTYFEATYIGA